MQAKIVINKQFFDGFLGRLNEQFHQIAPELVSKRGVLAVGGNYDELRRWWNVKRSRSNKSDSKQKMTQDIKEQAEAVKAAILTQLEEEYPAEYNHIYGESGWARLKAPVPTMQDAEGAQESSVIKAGASAEKEQPLEVDPPIVHKPKLPAEQPQKIAPLPAITLSVEESSRADRFLDDIDSMIHGKPLLAIHIFEGIYFRLATKLKEEAECAQFKQTCEMIYQRRHHLNHVGDIEMDLEAPVIGKRKRRASTESISEGNARQETGSLIQFSSGKMLKEVEAFTKEKKESDEEEKEQPTGKDPAAIQDAWAAIQSAISDSIAKVEANPPPSLDLAEKGRLMLSTPPLTLLGVQQLVNFINSDKFATKARKYFSASAVPPLQLSNSRLFTMVGCGHAADLAMLAFLTGSACIGIEQSEKVRLEAINAMQALRCDERYEMVGRLTTLQIPKDGGYSFDLCSHLFMKDFLFGKAHRESYFSFADNLMPNLLITTRDPIEANEEGLRNVVWLGQLALETKGSTLVVHLYAYRKFLECKPVDPNNPRVLKDCLTIRGAKPDCLFLLNFMIKKCKPSTTKWTEFHRQFVRYQMSVDSHVSGMPHLERALARLVRLMPAHLNFNEKELLLQIKRTITVKDIPSVFNE